MIAWILLPLLAGDPFSFCPQARVTQRKNKTTRGPSNSKGYIEHHLPFLFPRSSPSTFSRLHSYILRALLCYSDTFNLSPQSELPPHFSGASHRERWCFSDGLQKWPRKTPEPKDPQPMDCTDGLVRGQAFQVTQTPPLWIALAQSHLYIVYSLNAPCLTFYTRAIEIAFHSSPAVFLTFRFPINH